MRFGELPHDTPVFAHPLIVEIDPALGAKSSGIVQVTKPYGGQPSTFVVECRFVIAQLRSVLAAKDSAVVTKKYDHRRSVGP